MNNDNRRGFFKWLGLGAAAAATTPLLGSQLMATKKEDKEEDDPSAQGMVVSNEIIDMANKSFGSNCTFINCVFDIKQEPVDDFWDTPIASIFDTYVGDNVSGYAIGNGIYDYPVAEDGLPGISLKENSQEASVAPEFDYAIKPDRTIYRSDISFFMNEPAMRGCIVSRDRNEQSYNGAEVVKKQIGREEPVGLLLNDVVNIDSSSFANWTDTALALGGKVSICTNGELIMRVDGDAKVGNLAYSYNGVVNTREGVVVGKFLSSNDEDGFAKVNIFIASKHGVI